MAFGIWLDNYFGKGSGGGDAGGGVFVVKFTSSGTVPNVELTPDKTLSEALDAHNSGKLVVAVIESLNFGSGTSSAAIVLAYDGYMFDKLVGNAIVVSGTSTAEGNARAMQLNWHASGIVTNFYNV